LAIVRNLRVKKGEGEARESGEKRRCSQKEKEGIRRGGFAQASRNENLH